MPLTYTIANLSRRTGLKEPLSGHHRAMTLSLTHNLTIKKREEQQAGGGQARRPGIIIITVISLFAYSRMALFGRP